MGSSPLTRGKPHARRHDPRFPGLIPAHAGKTGRGCGSCGGRGAHPRSRGENRFSAAVLRAFGGSSPLTRGKRIRARPSSLAAGLIPAHAGKTSPGASTAPSVRAHPRSRGENALAGKAADELVGSSPLTRGKRGRRYSDHVGERLIPAHAGKTEIARAEDVNAKAHPRSRGENSYAATIAAMFAGSSPLTRGKRGAACFDARARGLIPAHAGKTRARHPHPHGDQAHPRSRGENEWVCAPQAGGGGSSPLTRGKHAVDESGGAGAGLIPAHAGKTNDHHRPGDDHRGSSPLTRGKPGNVVAVAGKRRAHPRSRGENACAAVREGGCAGSSPLTRGKRDTG